MGYQKSNTFKTLNHWQSYKQSDYTFLDKANGGAFSRAFINDKAYYIPPYLRFKDSTFTSIYKNYEGIIDFNNINIYKSEKYTRTATNVTGFRGVFSFGSDFLDYSPPEYYTPEYWENTFAMTYNYGDEWITYNKTSEIQDITENIIIPKVNRVGVFYSVIYNDYINKLPSWVSQFEETKEETFLPVVGITDLRDLYETANIYPQIWSKKIKVPKNFNIPSKDNYHLPNSQIYSIYGFVQDDINLEGKVKYTNGGCYLPQGLSLNPVPFGGILFGDLKGINSGTNLKGSTIINDAFYKKDNEIKHNAMLTDLFVKKEFYNENNELVGEYIFTIYYVIEELKAIDNQIIIKLKW